MANNSCIKDDIKSLQKNLNAIVTCEHFNIDGIQIITTEKQIQNQKLTL